MRIERKYLGIDLVLRPKQTRSGIEIFELDCFYKNDTIGSMTIKVPIKHDGNPILYDTNGRPIPTVQLKISDDQFNTAQVCAGLIATADPYYRRLFDKQLHSPATRRAPESVDRLAWRILDYEGRAEFTPIVDKGHSFDRWAMR